MTSSFWRAASSFWAMTCICCSRACISVRVRRASFCSCCSDAVAACAGGARHAAASAARATATSAVAKSRVVCLRMSMLSGKVSAGGDGP